MFAEALFPVPELEMSSIC